MEHDFRILSATLSYDEPDLSICNHQNNTHDNASNDQINEQQQYSSWYNSNKLFG